MSNGSERYLSILVSTPILLGSVAMILITIVILKKSKKYNQPIRVLMITLLIVTSGTAAYLAYLAIAFGNTYPPILPVPIL
ncbi:MAG: hypothetical protein ACYDH1_12175 [Anaerolineaceae bacterium]